MTRKPLPSIILASTSPRRIELLSQLGLRFSVVAPSVDETPKRGELPRVLVRRLAYLKASSVAAGLSDALAVSALVIAADTIVVSPSGGKILGKPRDRAEAARMLRALSGRTHTVLTGYCVLHGKRSIVRVVRSSVKMRRLSASALQAYLNTGESMDKAGAYAAQGYGMGLIERISGSYANVVGLPVAQLLEDLESRLGIPLFSWNGG